MPYKVYCVMKKGENSLMRSTEVRENTVAEALRKAEEYFYALCKKIGGKDFQIVMYKDI